MSALGSDAELRPSMPDGLPWQEIMLCFRRTHRALRIRLFYLLWSWQDADDVLQETYIKAAENWHTRRDTSEAATTAWLKTIAANLAANRHRERRTRREVALDDVLKVQELISAYLSPEQAHDARVALDTLRMLSDKERQAYLLKHYFGLDVEDIAHQLECKPATVRTHLHRAQKKLDQLGKASSERNRDRTGVERP